MAVKAGEEGRMNVNVWEKDSKWIQIPAIRRIMSEKHHGHADLTDPVFFELSRINAYLGYFYNNGVGAYSSKPVYRIYSS